MHDLDPLRRQQLTEIAGVTVCLLLLFSPILLLREGGHRQRAEPAVAPTPVTDTADPTVEGPAANGSHMTPDRLTALMDVVLNNEDVPAPTPFVKGDADIDRWTWAFESEWMATGLPNLTAVGPANLPVVSEGLARTGTGGGGGGMAGAGGGGGGSSRAGSAAASAQATLDSETHASDGSPESGRLSAASLHVPSANHAQGSAETPHDPHTPSGSSGQTLRSDGADGSTSSWTFVSDDDTNAATNPSVSLIPNGFLDSPSDGPSSNGANAITADAASAADPVPEPATLLLFGSGLAAIAYRLRRRTDDSGS